jgi:hypothetical protein
MMLYGITEEVGEVMLLWFVIILVAVHVVDRWLDWWRDH